MELMIPMDHARSCVYMEDSPYGQAARLFLICAGAPPQWCFWRRHGLKSCTCAGLSEKETLLKASHCCLSTTAGPIAGLLFISTRNIAFFSHRSLKLSCPNGDTVKVHYKVLIPLSKIERANQSKNVKKPSQKYIQIVTVDNFDFWFMGFLNYQKTWKYLQQALFLEHRCDK
ncbi:hypothetical protein CDL15_Pgr020952 [Punica granatum]|uniref:GRAM domain-containing protein n=1 Tax=Punica granatum TaxID=22663 RepID=A0A218Y014_PUNGR|nr:hypothetical protein CDL15_Pgr020952 [Punica granatum]